MSVLLEALKKAAEEKKKFSQSPTELSSDPSTQSKRGALLIKPSENEPFELRTDCLEESPDGANKVLDQTVPEKPQSSIRLSDESEDILDEKTVSIDDLDMDNEDDSKTQGSNQEFHEDDSHVDDNAPILSTNEVRIDEVLNSTLHSTNSQSIHEDPPLKGLSNQVDSDDSFDWSLAKLPGYGAHSLTDTQETDGLDKPEVPNPILSTNKRFSKRFRLSSIRQFIFGRSSNVAIYSLFSVLILSTVGFFSVYYFQQQEIELEQSMRKYNLVRTALPTELAANQHSQIESNSENSDLAVKEKTPIEVTIKPSLSEPLLIEETSDNKVNVGQSPVIISENDILEVSEPVAKLAVKPQVKPVLKKPTSVAQTPLVDNKKIVISQSNQESDIQQAYNALYAGDLKSANQYFEKALSSAPNNISVLNGLAATQAQLGNDSEALNYYQKVLSLDSTNLFAFEAMISILGDSLNGSEWKAEIKRVLKMHPQSSVLHYVLGNFYAKESDWKAAQTYYFDAYALDNSNAVYLVNLAVSLDQLGQYELAEKYYTLALVYSSGQSLNFEEEQIKQRLISLRQFIGSDSQ